MSIHPRFAEAILNGTKTVELRKTRVAADIGTLVVIYATAPTMAIVGHAILAARDTDSPRQIWRRHRHHMALTKTEFDTYTSGSALATALTLGAPERLDRLVSLATLRAESKFSPPQSYRYIAPADPSTLRTLAAR
jgi:predicted transcriptional regulator